MNDHQIFEKKNTRVLYLKSNLKLAHSFLILILQAFRRLTLRTVQSEMKAYGYIDRAMKLTPVLGTYHSTTQSPFTLREILKTFFFLHLTHRNRSFL